MDKIAIFDVDGTLFNGNLGIEFLKVLIHEHVFDQIIGQQIFDWYGKYQSGEVDKATVIDEICQLYAQGMTGLDVPHIALLAHQTWNEVKSRVFNFVPHLISQVKSHNYQVILLSGSPIEMIRELGTFLHLSLDLIIGGQLEIKEGIYTGKIDAYPGDAAQKVTYLRQLISLHHLDVDWSKSFALGDNKRDSQVMALVGHPIAFNPSPELKLLAQSQHWVIATENNVVAHFSANLI